VPGAYDQSQEDLTALLGDAPAFRSRQVWDGLYRRVLRPSEMTDLPLALRDSLESALPPALEPVAQRSADDGQTRKWSFRLHDGAVIETVLMHYPGRSTVCVSSQAGCAMACSFCATGQSGFRRHLTSGEILEQVAVAVRAARPRRLSNIVFMGMGEPLANFDNLWSAIVRIHDDFGLGARSMTVSTVGIIPGIRRLTAAPLPVGLAVSLHAATDALRNELVPINRRYPIEALMEACTDYRTETGRRVSFEWAMIDGVNDDEVQAGHLARLASDVRAHVNLIPLNPTPGYPVRGTPPGRIDEFRATLEARGTTVTIRSTRGSDIDAACGQLAAARTGTTPVELRRP
jgi:23S rRNA (adenine2503-C2)-methyltransferase